QPDLVLLDVRMPEMDGVAVAQLICQQFEEVKVLMLSTFDDEDYVCRAILSHRPLSLWDSEYGCGHYVLRKHKKQAFFHDFLCDRGQYRIASLSQKQSHT
ncbi:MAG: response regulator transcription factor, partial [Cyanobacteria bacterium J06560_6]